MANQITIEIEDNKNISIKQGSQDYGEDILSMSPNGKYYFSSGTWYTASSDSEVIILCTDSELLFKKKFIFSEDDIFVSRVFDDGKVLICTDSGIITLFDITGKQVMKKKTKIEVDSDRCGITPNFLYLFGDVYNDKKEAHDGYGLSILSLPDMEYISIDLPEYEHLSIDNGELNVETAFPDKICVVDSTITISYDNPECTTITFDGKGQAISILNKSSQTL